MKIRLLVVCALLLFSSLVCNVPMDDNAAQVPTATPVVALPPPGEAPSLDAPLSLEDADALLPKFNSLTLDEEIIDLITEDQDQDGRIDYLEYGLPVDPLGDRVYAWPRLVFRREQGDEFSQHFEVLFTNVDTVEHTFTYDVEIPKEFAAHVDEVTFSVPVEVIQADPLVRVSFTLGPRPGAYQRRAGLAAPMPAPDYRIVFGVTQRVTVFLADDPFALAAFRAKAAATLKKICQGETDPGERSVCVLNLIEDFKDLMEKEEMRGLCAEAQGIEQVMCTALIDRSYDACYAAESAAEADLCKAYVMADECSQETLEERDACYMRLALQQNSVVGCLAISDESLENSCLAQRLKDPAYCQRITEAPVREACMEKMRQKGLVGPVIAPPEALEPSSLVFAEDQALDHCERIGAGQLERDSFGVRSAKVTAGNLLECEFMRPNDDTHARVAVVIYAYASAADARTAWDQSWGPLSPGAIRYKERQGKGEPVKIEFSGASFVASEVVTSGDKTSYDAHSGKLFGATVIIYRHSLPQSGVTIYLIETLTAAQDLVSALGGEP